MIQSGAFLEKKSNFAILNATIAFNVQINNLIIINSAQNK
jgi:hypothetical protein